MRYSGWMRSPAGRVAIAISAVAVSAALGACHTAAPNAGKTSSTPTTTAVSYSTDDVAFLRNMIQHYRQDVQLAMMVPKHTANQALAEVAQQIGGTELGEIQAFEAQLLQWEVDPNTGDDGENAGLVDDDTVDRLRTLRDAEFDNLWLPTMIEQHRTAIAMARNEIEHGQSPDIKGLAQLVVTSQQDGIDRMEKLSGS